jgi:hypothetical protein
MYASKLTFAGLVGGPSIGERTGSRQVQRR